MTCSVWFLKYVPSPHLSVTQVRMLFCRNPRVHEFQRSFHRCIRRPASKSQGSSTRAETPVRRTPANRVADRNPASNSKNPARVASKVDRRISRARSDNASRISMDEPGTAGFFHLTSLSALTSRAQPPSRKSGEECALESGGTPSVGSRVTGMGVGAEACDHGTAPAPRSLCFAVVPNITGDRRRGDRVSGVQQSLSSGHERSSSRVGA
jgi:hypothetical protein